MTITSKELSQLRMRLHMARTEALAAQVRAAREWGDQCSIATYAGQAINQLDAAINEVDIEASLRIEDGRR